MKTIKYVMFAVGGLVVLAGAVLAYIAATFDPNQYKPQVVQAVKERTQRTLTRRRHQALVLAEHRGEDRQDLAVGTRE